MRRPQPDPRFHSYSDSAKLRIRIHFLLTLINHQWTVNISFSVDGCELRPHYWQVTRWKAPGIQGASSTNCGLSSVATLFDIQTQKLETYST